MMEKFQTHDLQDQYRVQNGLIVVVNKFSRKEWVGSFDKKKTIKVKGIKNTYAVKEPFQTYRSGLLAKGTLIHESHVIEPITATSEFTFEIKTNGAIIGTAVEQAHLLNQIQDILDSYK